MSVFHLNDQDFDRSLNEFEGTVLVDFWAPWCAPCRAMSGIVDDVAGEVGESAKVVKANVDESPATAQKYGVSSIPTFVVLHHGKVKDQFSGVVSKQTLLNAIQSPPD